MCSLFILKKTMSFRPFKMDVDTRLTIKLSYLILGEWSEPSNSMGYPPAFVQFEDRSIMNVPDSVVQTNAHILIIVKIHDLLWIAILLV